MGKNPKGDTGIDVKTVINDKVVIVGDHPNLNPSVYTEPTGTEINGYGMTESVGVTQTKGALPSNTPIDNAGDFHGGTLTYTVMNSLHFEVANGGITMDTGGNVNISSWGGIVNLLSSTEVGITSDLVKLNVTNTLMINGPTLYVDSQETIFNNNVTFGNNALIRGGLGVNGELIAAHITTQRQLNFTEECDTLLGYPMMGASVDVVLIPTSNPLLTGTCKIMFTPTMQTPIVAIPGHDHVFEGPACTLADGVTDLFSKMSKVEGNSPVEADPAMPMNLSLSGLMNKITKRVTDKVGKFIKEAIGL